MSAPALRSHPQQRELGIRELSTPPLRHLRAAPTACDEDEIPEPPEGFVRALAARAYEVVQGMRGTAQLGSTVTVGAARQLVAQRSATIEQRSVCRDARSRIAEVGRLRLCMVRPGIAEATVVMHTSRRSYSVALRLEWLHGRWQASELYVI